MTVVVHVALAAKVVVHVVDTNVKSVPVTEAAVGGVTVILANPVFVNVEVPEALEPTAALPTFTALRVALAACPVPVRPKLEEPPTPSCAMVTVPVRVPTAVGVKDTVTVQVPFTASGVPQLFEAPKSLDPVETDTPLMVNAAVPVLVTVTDCVAEVVETCCAANVKDVGDKLAMPCVPVPVSVSVMEPALVARASAPVRATLLVGANLTVVVQVLLAAKVVAHVVDTKLKSVPVVEVAVGTVTLMAANPVLVRVALAVVLVPTFRLPKATLLKVALAAWPVPVRLTVPVPFEASDVTVTAPVRVPAADGVNVTVTEQVPLMANAEPQVVLEA